MGEVWRPRDAKPGREVAIKTLPEEIAKDADRLARIEREARLLASLNHSNIAVIHGFEEDNGMHFLSLGSNAADFPASRPSLVWRAKNPLTAQSLTCFKLTAKCRNGLNR